MSSKKQRTSPVAAFSPTTARYGQYGDAGCLLFLSDIKAYLHLVRAASLIGNQDGKGQPTQHFHALAQTSGLLRAAAITTFVYGKEVSRPHPTLREWRWTDGETQVSYYIPAKAANIHPERQRNPKLAISHRNRMVADDASTFLLPGQWMGRIVTAYPYALEHLDKRRAEVFKPA